jgi:hypothetical protein
MEEGTFKGMNMRQRANLLKPFLATITLSLIGCAVTACGGLSVTVRTPAAIKAEGDRDSGLITNGKASADVNDTPYYQLRREQGSGEGIVNLSRALFGGSNGK